MELFERLVNSQLVQWVAASDWGYPIVLTLHAIGMALVVGIVMMFDIRVLGYARRISIAGFPQLFPVLWLGVVINVCSGSLLFLANYTAFIRNTAFLTKISLLVVGGIATYFLHHDVKASDPAGSRAKVIAALSLLVWLGAIAAGRIVGYTSVPE